MDLDKVLMIWIFVIAIFAIEGLYLHCGGWIDNIIDYFKEQKTIALKVKENKHYMKR